MSNLYSLNQAYPAPLPFRVMLSDGTTRTDPDQYSQDAAVMTDIGAVLAPAQPAYDADTQQLGWTGTAWTVDAKPPVVMDRLILRDVFLNELIPADHESIVEYLHEMPAVGADRNKWKKAKAAYNSVIARELIDRDRQDDRTPGHPDSVFKQLTNFFESEGLLSVGEALRLQDM